MVDSHSTDATAAIAQQLGARVLQRPFDGFRSQKQFAVEQATHDWVLCLDADERVSDALRGAIEAARACAVSTARRATASRACREYFGKFLRHGNAYPDRVLRLFDRRRGGWRGTREVHEAASVDGPVRTLRGDLIHYPYRSLEQQLLKTQRYARMMAEHDFARGKRATLAKLVLAPAWRFWRGYVLRLGFLDGWHGLVYAYVRANYVRQKTIMLWMLQNGQPVSDARALAAGGTLSGSRGRVARHQPPAAAVGMAQVHRARCGRRTPPAPPPAPAASAAPVAAPAMRALGASARRTAP